MVGGGTNWRVETGTTPAPRFKRQAVDSITEQQFDRWKPEIEAKRPRLWQDSGQIAPKCRSTHPFYLFCHWSFFPPVLCSWPQGYWFQIGFLARHVPEMNSALYFDDLTVGQKWMSARRTVTESDVIIFAGMTGDFDRAHVDHDYASKSRFKQPLMHGLMGLTWAAGLSTTAPAVRTLALVSVDDWKFVRPVHIGDTVCAVTEVLELASGGRSAGKVTWKKSLVNQDGDEVQSGIFVSFVELTPRGTRQPALSSSKTELPAKSEPAKSESAKNEPAKNQPTIPSPHFFVAEQQVVSSNPDLSGGLAGTHAGLSEARLVEPPPIHLLSELPQNDPGSADSQVQSSVWTIESHSKSGNKTGNENSKGESEATRPGSAKQGFVIEYLTEKSG